MYIIAIAWLYVVTLMAATEKSVIAGLLTFVFYGLLPCTLFLWLLGTKHRRYKKGERAAKNQLLEENMPEQNSADAKPDQ